MNWLSNLFRNFFKKGQDQPSPSDFVSKESIPLLLTLVTAFLAQAKLNVPFDLTPKVWMPSIVSKSLDPVMDVGHHPILIAGANKTDHKKLINFIKVGDIAVYRFPADMSKPATAFIEHRIVEIGRDNQGKFFRFKGDNNNSIDPWIVREKNIKWVVIGIMYGGKKH